MLRDDTYSVCMKHWGREDYTMNFTFPNYNLGHVSLLLFILFRKREGCANVMANIVHRMAEIHSYRHGAEWGRCLLRSREFDWGRAMIAVASASYCSCRRCEFKPQAITQYNFMALREKSCVVGLRKRFL